MGWWSILVLLSSWRTFSARSISAYPDRRRNRWRHWWRWPRPRRSRWSSIESRRRRDVQRKRPEEETNGHRQKSTEFEVLQNVCHDEGRCKEQNREEEHVRNIGLAGQTITFRATEVVSAVFDAVLEEVDREKLRDRLNLHRLWRRSSSSMFRSERCSYSSPVTPHRCAIGQVVDDRYRSFYRRLHRWRWCRSMLRSFPLEWRRTRVETFLSLFSARDTDRWI